MSRNLGMIPKLFCCRRNPMKIKQVVRRSSRPAYFTTEFEKERMDEFLVETGETQLFTSIQRIRIVWEIMQKTVVYVDEVPRKLSRHSASGYANLSFLLSAGVYTSAYPLHDSDVECSAYYPQPIAGQMRHWLAEFWGRLGRCNKHQPLHEIRAYFGEKVAMYFAWLGFYTIMLLPLSLFGLFCFLYGFAMFSSDEPLKDVCFQPLNETVICRPCASSNCEYSRLGDYCKEAITNAIIGNPVAIPFAIVTCVWSVVMLELLMRRQARLACAWGTVGLSHEYEPPRTQYQAVARKNLRHPVTHQWEPYVPGIDQSFRFIRSIVAVTFFICVVLAVVIGIIVYRAFMAARFHKLGNHAIHTMGCSTFTIVTASLISVICMVILEKIYWTIAYHLTEWEYPRTDTDFEDSFTIKIYVFQFVNYYAALFYLAFVQGLEFLAPPGNNPAHFSAYCSPIGCTFSVTVQLCTILVVKQMLFNVVEIAIPFSRNCLRNYKKDYKAAQTRYEKDFQLPEMSHLGLLDEYLEMVLQFGFVVMFGAIFPLAPLIAMINNIAEIRVDAYKFLSARRVVPQRVANIGNWFKILEAICRVGMLTNGCLIAFTTNLVDRGYYWLIGKQGDLIGFIEFTLSRFNTSHWNNESLLWSRKYGGNITECFYNGHFYPPEHEQKYEISREGLGIILCKVCFVVLFENVMWWIHSLIRYAIANEPEDVKIHLLRNHYVAKEWLTKYDYDKMKFTTQSSDKTHRCRSCSV